MQRSSILRLVPCKVTELPIGAREAFVLSQVDGQSTVDELADIAGIGAAEFLRIARRLEELGALAVVAAPSWSKGPPAPRPSKAPPAPRASKGPPAPRSTKGPPAPRSTKGPPAPRSTKGPPAPRSTKGPPAPRSSKGPPAPRASKPAPRPSRENVLAPGRHSSARTSRAPKRTIRTPIATPKVSAPPPPASATALALAPSADCDLEQAAQARILELHARLEQLDHYALLEVEREADKKAIKRGYFARAAMFHPDKYFGKKLGALRLPLEQIFVRITLAHDTLANKIRRAEYDATLPRITSKPASKRPSVKPPSIKPASVEPPRAPSVRPPASARAPSIKPPKRTSVRPSKSKRPPPPDPRVIADTALKRFFAESVQSNRNHKADMFLRAAEDALKKDDVVAAANHFRLAVQITDDPAVRAALEETDVKARARVYETSLARARDAEQSRRWQDAATHWTKAHGARGEPWIAERAASAIRHHGGDLHRAAELAGQAVLAEPSNASYRTTLGEIYLDAKLYARAAGEANRALALAPNDVRARALVAAVAKVKQKK